ncbi:MAG: Gfo/Idh/MocA family protein [Christensenellales bacterium]
MLDKIKLGVVGLHRGLAHVKAGKIAPHVEISAVADLDRELALTVGKENGISEVYGSLDELLAVSDCDAVMIATPIPDHANHVVASLESGKHVLSEVTSCTERDDLPRIADAVRKTGKRYMLAENYVYIRSWTIVRNMAKAGLFGDIYYAESDYLMDFQLRPNFPDGLQPWRKEAYFGRHGHPYITHTLGPLAHIMGERIKTVTCMEAGHQYNLTSPNTCVLMLQTENGNMIRLRNSFVSSRPDIYTYYSIQGTNGCYQGPQGPTDFHKVHIKGLCKPNEWRNLFDFSGFLPTEWRMYTKSGIVFHDAFDDGVSMYDSGCALMLDEFATALIYGTDMPISLEDALNWTAAGLLSHDSAVNGSMPVQVPDY